MSIPLQYFCKDISVSNKISKFLIVRTTILEPGRQSVPVVQWYLREQSLHWFYFIKPNIRNFSQKTETESQLETESFLSISRLFFRFPTCLHSFLSRGSDCVPNCIFVDFPLFTRSNLSRVSMILHLLRKFSSDLFFYWSSSSF